MRPLQTTLLSNCYSIAHVRSNCVDPSSVKPQHSCVRIHTTWCRRARNSLFQPDAHQVIQHDRPVAEVEGQNVILVA